MGGEPGIFPSPRAYVGGELGMFASSRVYIEGGKTSTTIYKLTGRRLTCSCLPEPTAISLKGDLGANMEEIVGGVTPRTSLR